ncbi:Uncharacterised protein [Mycobacteroides abscessus subsp. abscessus]|nr:Uncharacterised protein [Mycobacteroides abscessus subsp. abscessus]
MPVPSSSPRAPICRPRSNWRHGSTARARRFSSSVPWSRSTAAVSGDPTPSRAETPGIRGTCVTRPRTAPATTRWRAWARSSRRRPPIAPTPSPPEIPRTTTPMPPRTLRRYAPNGTCPPWRSWVSAAAPGSPWPMPDRTPTKWRGSCSTRRWPPTSRRRQLPNSGSRASSPHSTRSPRSVSPTTARSGPIRPGPSATC